MEHIEKLITLPQSAYKHENQKISFLKKAITDQMVAAAMVSTTGEEH